MRLPPTANTGPLIRAYQLRQSLEAERTRLSVVSAPIRAQGLGQSSGGRQASGLDVRLIRVEAAKKRVKAIERKLSAACREGRQLLLQAGTSPFALFCERRYLMGETIEAAREAAEVSRRTADRFTALVRAQARF